MNVIAIDGSSSAGKGTLALRLAEKLDYAYLDTGALYRGVGYELLQKGLDPQDEEAAVQVAKSLSVERMLSLQDDSCIRNEVCGKAASYVSRLPKVREALFDFQRRFAFFPIKKDKTPAKGAILDGRDIGTVICPEAKIKLFLTASSEIRAKRRYKELQLK
ncbi:MAG: (d)CMP kinase, partial [Alphaproteobacteria bacterium]|nr:(d)CMP kinase [Alphaproteobacteria bacterium]